MDIERDMEDPRDREDERRRRRRERDEWEESRADDDWAERWEDE